MISICCVIYLANEEDTDFLDVDLVEFHQDEFQDIATILKVSDTSKDKLTFMVQDKD